MLSACMHFTLVCMYIYLAPDYFIVLEFFSNNHSWLVQFVYLVWSTLKSLFVFLNHVWLPWWHQKENFQIKSISSIFLPRATPPYRLIEDLQWVLVGLLSNHKDHNHDICKYMAELKQSFFPHNRPLKEQK